MPDSRVTRVGRHPYNTASHKCKAVRTPGGKLVSHKIVKKSKGPVCANPGCRISLPGIKHLKMSKYKNLKKRERRVSRAYGGSFCGTCVREKILRAFLLEEQKVVKKVLAESQGKRSK